jgi:hypothetical protein
VFLNHNFHGTPIKVRLVFVDEIGALSDNLINHLRILRRAGQKPLPRSLRIKFIDALI